MILRGGAVFQIKLKKTMQDENETPSLYEALEKVILGCLGKQQDYGKAFYRTCLALFVKQHQSN